LFFLFLGFFWFLEAPRPISTRSTSTSTSTCHVQYAAFALRGWGPRPSQDLVGVSRYYLSKAGVICDMRHAISLFICLLLCLCTLATCWCCPPPPHNFGCANSSYWCGPSLFLAAPPISTSTATSHQDCHYHLTTATLRCGRRT
jgi:hypothetical protein